MSAIPRGGSCKAVCAALEVFMRVTHVAARGARARVRVVVQEVGPRVEATHERHEELARVMLVSIVKMPQIRMRLQAIEAEFHGKQRAPPERTPSHAYSNPKPACTGRWREARL